MLIKNLFLTRKARYISQANRIPPIPSLLIQKIEHKQSLLTPNSFWKTQSKLIDWIKPPSQIYNPITAKWFQDSTLNVCYNALDRHLEKDADTICVIHKSAYTGLSTKISYLEMTSRVSQFASVLRSQFRVKKHDVVLIYMPMIPETMIAMLACARLGAVHCVVFGGFKPKELAKRIRDCNPVLIITASCGVEPDKVIGYKPLIDEALNIVMVKLDTITVQRQEHQSIFTRDNEYEWDHVVKINNGKFTECVPVESTDPLYILYTSGSTGPPKGVVRDSGGHAVALNWSMSHVFGVKRGDVYCCASDFGWILGHSYLAYAPLLAGITTVIYEGKPTTPDSGAFWNLIAEFGITQLFISPTAARAIKHLDVAGDSAKLSDLSTLRNVWVAGERCDNDTMVWLSEILGVPIRDNYWQTETGSPITSSNVANTDKTATTTKPGSSGLPVAGNDVKILDESTGIEVGPNIPGAIVLKLPLPPGAVTTLQGNLSGFLSNYFQKFPGFFDLSDCGHIDNEGYLHVTSRTDDIINVAAHRIGSSSIESAISSHPAVVECAVVGLNDSIKGHLPFLLVVIRHGEKSVVAKEIVGIIRGDIGEFVCLYPYNILFVKRLPKTRSGKIVRKLIKLIINGEDWQVPATIEDEIVIDEIVDAFRNM